MTGLDLALSEALERTSELASFGKNGTIDPCQSALRGAICKKMPYAVPAAPLGFITPFATLAR